MLENGMGLEVRPQLKILLTEITVETRFYQRILTEIEIAVLASTPI
jgi:hypothetical protein